MKNTYGMNPPYSMNNDYSDKTALVNNFRSIWEQHVWWTRMVILGIVDNLPGLDESVARLLKNPKDMANIFRMYYPANIANTVEKLVEEHLTIGAEVIKSAKAGNTAMFKEQEMLWYKNADSIAKAFASFNPYYNENEIKKMFYDHLDMTTKEVQMRLAKNYTADVMVFDSIEKEALKMADYFAQGIMKQFNNLR